MANSPCANCRGLYTEWRDCDLHENDCYVLMCYACGHDDYDCQEQLTKKEIANVQD
jgi:hypothetical protein